MGGWLFCLLLLLSPAADALALATPEGDDDLAAAEDNDYLARPRAGREERRRQPAPPAASPEAGLASLPLTTSMRARAPRRCAHTRPDPLYALMSLQR
jgi:hypothetical protein